MSDERNVSENGLMVDNFYAEPYDVFKYLRSENVDEFINFLIDSAINFYEENSFSPIIEQKDERFVIDYYFVVDCLSKFIENKVMVQVDDIKFVKSVRIKFKNDFAESGDLFAKNASFLLAILDYLDILVYQKRGTALFSRTLYSTFDSYGEQIPFVIASIFMHTNKFKSFERNLKMIGRKDNYKVEAFGRSLGSVLLKFGRKGKTVKQF